jgi:hypothetical protein
LRVRTGPAGDVADEQPRGLVALDDCRKALHVAMIPCEGPPNKPLQRSRVNAKAFGGHACGDRPTQVAEWLSG